MSDQLSLPGTSTSSQSVGFCEQQVKGKKCIVEQTQSVLNINATISPIPTSSANARKTMAKLQCTPSELPAKQVEHNDFRSKCGKPVNTNTDYGNGDKSARHFTPGDFQVSPSQNIYNMQTILRTLPSEKFDYHKVGKYLETSDKYSTQSAAGACRIINDEKENVFKSVRIRAKQFFTELREVYNSQVDKVSAEKLKLMIDIICAICNPSSHNLTPFLNEISTLLINGDYENMFLQLRANQNLRNRLGQTAFGSVVLKQMREVFPLDVAISELNQRQQQFLDIIQALCTPIDNLNLHQICELDITGKNLIEITHYLSKNTGIKKILNDTFYGQSIWFNLLNHPVYFKTLSVRANIESLLEKIELKKEKIKQIDNLSLIWRALNVLSRAITRREIEELHKKIKSESLMLELILLGTDLFRTLWQIQRCGVQNSLMGLLSSDDRIMRDIITNGLNLEEIANQVSPVLLVDCQRCEEFVRICYLLSACDAFFEHDNINGRAIKLFNTMMEFHPLTPDDIEIFLNQLKKSQQFFFAGIGKEKTEANNNANTEVCASIISAMVFLRPDLAWIDIKRILLVIENMPSSVNFHNRQYNDAMQQYINSFEQWSGPYANHSDKATVTRIVHSYFKSGMEGKINEIADDISRRLRDSLSTEVLKENFYRSLKNIIDDNLIKKLDIGKEQLKQIESEMLDYLLICGRYSDNKREAIFNTTIAQILKLPSEMLAYKLKKQNLTTEHYKEYHHNGDDRLLTMAHIDDIEHFGILHIDISAFISKLKDAYDAFNVMKLFFAPQPELSAYIAALLTSMTDILYKREKNKISEFKEMVNIFFDSAIFEEFMASIQDNEEVTDALMTIKAGLLSLSLPDISILFNKIEKLGIHFSAKDSENFKTYIDELLKSTEHSQPEINRLILNYLLRLTLESGSIKTPQVQFKGQSHEFLDALTRSLHENMTRIKKAEAIRLMAEWGITSSNMDYTKIACEFINGASNNVTKTPPSNKERRGQELKKLSPEEASYFSKKLDEMLSEKITAPQDKIMEIVEEFRRSRNIKVLKDVANYHFLYVTLNNLRNKYRNEQDDAKRRQMIEEMYKIIINMDNHDTLNTFYQVQEKEKKCYSAQEFIKYTDKKEQVSGSLMCKMVNLDTRLREIISQRYADSVEEYKKENEACQRENALSYHYYENELSKYQYERDRRARDLFQQCSHLTELDYKYNFRQWQNDNKTESQLATLLQMEAHQQWLNTKLLVVCNVRGVVDIKMAADSKITVNNNKGAAGGINRHQFLHSGLHTDKLFMVEVSRKELLAAQEDRQFSYKDGLADQQLIESKKGFMPTSNPAEMTATEEQVLPFDGQCLTLEAFMKVVVGANSNFTVVKVMEKNRENAGCYPTEYPRPFDCGALANYLITENSGISPDAPRYAQQAANGSGYDAGGTSGPSESARSSNMTEILLAPPPAFADPRINPDWRVYRRGDRPDNISTDVTQQRAMQQTALKLTAMQEAALQQKTLQQTAPQPALMQQTTVKLTAEQRAAPPEPIELTKGQKQRTELREAIFRLNLSRQKSAPVPDKTQPIYRKPTGSHLTGLSSAPDLVPLQINSRAGDRLIESLVRHMYQCYQPDDSSVQAWVKHYRSVLATRNWLNTAPTNQDQDGSQKPAGNHPGAMTLNIPVLLTLIDIINADLQRSHKDPMRVMIHQMVERRNEQHPTGKVTVTEVYTCEPSVGRDVHILLRDGHFMPLISKEAARKLPK
ncbi:hypothetical protein N5923_14450 [Erwiniaceae bacterium BAC15a-03b]|uniref:Uncharacterized protein n=1 Tax=Winslowiella arboricola TaxID=2978220 RepID=A0A9J6PSP7_9GAMM|nr:hypothetical protein [Winslowiella arboricola]MCU5772659.1 hypothetical protein [Winslowiella arboricola]MCU5778693.1 hypothetical protein [Winslowiella arboricola]